MIIIGFIFIRDQIKSESEKCGLTTEQVVDNQAQLTVQINCPCGTDIYLGFVISCYINSHNKLLH